MTYTCTYCGEELFPGIKHNCTHSSTNNGGSTDYYKLPTNATDLQDLIEYRQMNFSQGNMFKALYRANVDSNVHSSYERDLNKIIWFAQRELARIKENNEN